MVLELIVNMKISVGVYDKVVLWWSNQVAQKVKLAALTWKGEICERLIDDEMQFVEICESTFVKRKLFMQTKCIPRHIQVLIM